MNQFTRSVFFMVSVLASGKALAWDHSYRDYDRGRHYGHYEHRGHHGSSDDAAWLVGGVLLGAAIADMADRPRTTYTTTRYEERYVPSYSSSTYYYPDTYSTTTYTRTYPSRVVVREVEPERVYSREVTRDERGICYEVSYRDGRRILREIASYNCRRY